MNSLEKAFDPSMRAARALGPKTGIPTGPDEPAINRVDGYVHTFTEVALDAIDKWLFGARYHEFDLSEG